MATNAQSQCHSSLGLVYTWGASEKGETIQLQDLLCQVRMQGQSVQTVQVFNSH